jgi:hypothetical protein
MLIVEGGIKVGKQAKMPSLFSIISWIGILLITISTITNAQTQSPTISPTSNYSDHWENRYDVGIQQFQVDIQGTSGKTTFTFHTSTFLQGTDTITNVALSSSRNAWMGFLLGFRMAGAIAIVALDPNDPGNKALGLPAVSLVVLGQAFGPNDPPQSLVTPLVGGLEQNGLTNVNFAIIGGIPQLNFTITKSKATQFPIQGVGAAGTAQDASFVTGATQTLAYHDGYDFSKAVFAVPPGGLGGQIPATAITVTLPASIVAHIIMMMIAWLFLLPLGGIVALTRIRRGPNVSNSWFKVHRGLQMTGVAIVVGGVIAGILGVEDFVRPHFTQGHDGIGYTIGVFSMIQIVNGLMRPHAPPMGEKPTLERSRWFLSHRSLACLLLLAGVGNCIIGAALLIQIVGGGNNVIVLFDGTGGIASQDLFTAVLVLAIIAYLALMGAVVVEPYRRRREARTEDMDQPRKPQINAPAGFGGGNQYAGNDMPQVPARTMGVNGGGGIGGGVINPPLNQFGSVSQPAYNYGGATASNFGMSSQFGGSSGNSGGFSYSNNNSGPSRMGGPPQASPRTMSPPPGNFEGGYSQPPSRNISMQSVPSVIFEGGGGFDEYKKPSKTALPSNDFGGYGGAEIPQVPPRTMIPGGYPGVPFNSPSGGPPPRPPRNANMMGGYN